LNPHSKGSTESIKLPAFDQLDFLQKPKAYQPMQGSTHPRKADFFSLLSERMVYPFGAPMTSTTLILEKMEIFLALTG